METTTGWGLRVEGEHEGMEKKMETTVGFGVGMKE